MLQEADIWLFRLINQGEHPGWLDQTMLLLSGEVLWVSLYAFVLGLAVYRRSWPAIVTCLLIAVAMGLSDATAYQLLKPTFGRYRPCHEFEWVRLVAGCGGRMSFPSNHASNGMAAVMTIMAAGYLRWGMLLGVGIFFVGLSRIYLGVHYPGDILFGFLFGGFVGWCVVKVARNVLHLRFGPEPGSG